MAITEKRSAARAPGRPRPRPKGRPGGARRRMLPWAMIAPAAAALILIQGYPLARLLVLSTQNFGPRSLFTGQADFVGADNFTALFGDPDFRAVLLRTLVFTVVCVALLMVLGFLLSHLLTGVSPWARVVTTVSLVLVWAMPMVAATLVWQWMYQPQYGVANWLLTKLRVFGDLTAYDWFSHPDQALGLVILLTVWKGLPFVALTLFAARGQIPEPLYEAARLDGAGTLQTFRHITVPILRPVLGILTLLEVIWSVNSFTPIWVLTQGGPDGRTTTLGVYAYVTAFSRNDYGSGASVAVVTVLILAVLSIAYVRRLADQGDEQGGPA
ncbi:carbohydrate ABC transporter membrane protein 1, CUT1 family [Actinacidiphila guanduensis]|uniref:Carbohydrate ABC transporter membrane protein 1, CUT1 family n=2 Tax=Actinacidiphila guanduensis TaxID=310781 RepID=A0A1H0B4K1_9ACTN|nr:carbohydrate ABC transporter membrane protein 1, CUT1 family [Actinacidiphila guanduensis]